MIRSSRLSLRLASVSLAAAGLLACRTPSSKIPLEKLSADEEAEAQGQTREVIEPLPIERPADLLPPEVGVMTEVSEPAALLGLFGPLDKYEWLDSGRVELRGLLGHDLFDAEQWDELGLDSHGALGFGLLDGRSMAFFAYVTLVDEAAFEQTLLRVADTLGSRDELATSEIGGARVYRLGRRANVVVRDRIALLLHVDDPEQAPRDYVVMAATVDPRESLGHAEQFVWARQQLRPEDDAMFYLNPPALIEQLERGRSDGSDYGVRYAEEELARARQSGAPLERIRELEVRVEDERRWQREREQRKAGERELIQALFGSIRVVIGAADLRTDGIVGHGRLLIPTPSVLRRIFLPPEHESPLLSALAEPPLFGLDGRVDLQVLLELAELIARAEGRSLASLERDFEKQTGINMITGLIPALSGEGGIMLSKAREPNPQRLGEVPKSLGLAGYAGLREPDTIRKLLDKLARDKLLGGALVRAKRGDGWVLRIPKWHEVGLTIVGDRLVVSTDAKLATRIRDAERGAQAEALAAAEHPLRGPIASPSVRIYQRWVGFVLVDTHEPWKQDAESMLYDINSHHTLSPEEAAKVPRSREYKAKLAELRKAVDELDAFELRRAREKFARELAFAETLGDMGLQIEPLADGLGVAGQWRFAAGTTPLELVAQWFGGFSRDQDWAEYNRLSSRTHELVSELRAIRQGDLDAAAAKRR
ncbi:MAG: hypothetical protein R6X02_02935 [Enhygromyxa sp.]